MIEVPSTGIFETTSPRQWFLPHHPVQHPLEPDKVRRVLNGDAKFRYVSLNSALLRGPVLLQNLLQILLRFRIHRFAVSAVTEGMFLQVGVPEKDQPFLQFLWRKTPLEVIKVYQYTRHNFCAKDSPTCANYALKRRSLNNAVKFPEAALAVKQNFYMDDYLDSRLPVEGIESLANDLIHLLSIGGFKLTKWISMAPQLADGLNIFANSHHKRQTEMSSASSIQEDIDKTQTDIMLSPRQRTSEST